MTPIFAGSKAGRKIKRRRRRKDKTLPAWTELPHDITINILHILGAIEILEKAQKVCKIWRSLCKDPSMWRVIDMRYLYKLPSSSRHEIICREAMDKSQGDLVDIHLEYFASDELLDYIGERSGKLRRLYLTCCYTLSSEGFTKFIKGLLLLEEFHNILTPIDDKDIETVGWSCPLLRSFAFYKRPLVSNLYDNNVYAFAIARSIPELRHLQLLGNDLTNEELEAILNGCPHLESLNLGRCHYVKLSRDL